MKSVISFIDKIRKTSEPGIEEIKNGLLAAMADIEELKDRAKVTEPSTMNLVLSDGSSMVATRYVSTGEESNSLYYSTMGRYSCRQGTCQMDKGDGAILVVSEPLSSSESWRKVENNHLVTVDGKKDISTQPIQLPR